MPAIDIVRREARRLHRAATSSSLDASLPVLRRLLAAGLLPVRTLPEAHRRREAVQRKHLLRLLAIEAGHPQWETWRPLLAGGTAPVPDYAAVRDAGRLKHWFTDPRDAQRHAAGRGGAVVRIGAHAVVVTTTADGSEASHE